MAILYAVCEKDCEKQQKTEWNWMAVIRRASLEVFQVGLLYI